MARKSRTTPQNQIKQDQPKYMAGLYTRVSVNEDGNNPSVGNQEIILRDFIKQYKDIAVYTTYVDNGISSFEQKRPAFEEMINDIRNKLINCVVVNGISRFTRNYIEAGEYSEGIFPFLGIRFISALEEFDSLYDEPSRLTLQLRTLFAYEYSRELSVKVGSILEYKQKVGKYIPARLPYGY